MGVFRARCMLVSAMNGDAAVRDKDVEISELKIAAAELQSQLHAREQENDALLQQVATLQAGLGKAEGWEGKATDAAQQAEARKEVDAKAAAKRQAERKQGRRKQRRRKHGRRRLRRRRWLERRRRRRVP